MLHVRVISSGFHAEKMRAIEKILRKVINNKEKPSIIKAEKP